MGAGGGGGQGIRNAGVSRAFEQKGQGGAKGRSPAKKRVYPCMPPSGIPDRKKKIPGRKGFRFLRGTVCGGKDMGRRGENIFRQEKVGENGAVQFVNARGGERPWKAAKNDLGVKRNHAGKKGRSESLYQTRSYRGRPEEQGSHYLG